MVRTLIAALVMAALPAAASAQDGSVATTGPVIIGYGPHVEVDADMQIPAGTAFKVVFDGTRAAAEGEVDPTMQTAARFINMHASAGIAPDDIQLALVIHGAGQFDFISDAAWAARGKGDANPSSDLLRQLLAHNVRVILCGQSAAGNGIDKAELAPGVELALSAMTAHALLQQEGYTLNPF